MAADTKIQWTDHSASPWHGCAHASYTDAAGDDHPHVGCLRCYAEKGALRNPSTLGVWGDKGTRVRSASFWDNCRRWNKQAEADYQRWQHAVENFQGGEYDQLAPFHRPTVFPSICDPFEEWGGPILDSKGNRLMCCTHNGCTARGEPVPGKNCIFCLRELRPVTMGDLRRDLFTTINACPWLDFLLLTKRPQNVRRMWPSADMFDSESEHKAYWPNIWLLTSVSDQATADAMIPSLLECRDLVPVLGLSVEPLIGSVDLAGALNDCQCGKCDYCLDVADHPTNRVNYVIVGGKSGHGARPCDLQWIRAIVEQCRDAKVACFVKQLGALTVDSAFPEPDGTPSLIIGLKDKKGGTPEEWPEELRVRQYPTVSA